MVHWFAMEESIRNPRFRRLPQDPFAIKRFSKTHPFRLSFTARSRMMDRVSQFLYKRYWLPSKNADGLPPLPNADFQETAVTPVQLQHLLAALACSENLSGTCVVEVGCWAGVTTKALAECTKRRVYAIDPYLHEGGLSPILEK